MSMQLLVVEDDDALREQLQRRLASRNFEVHGAACAQQAIELINSLSKLDAALLDQNLDGDNGLDLIEPILQRFPDCRIIMHTGYGSIPAAVAATRRGASDYLTKPASLQQLVDALTAASMEAVTPPLPARSRSSTTSSRVPPTTPASSTPTRRVRACCW